MTNWRSKTSLKSPVYGPTYLEMLLEDIGQLKKQLKHPEMQSREFKSGLELHKERLDRLISQHKDIRNTINSCTLDQLLDEMEECENRIEQCRNKVQEGLLELDYISELYKIRAQTLEMIRIKKKYPQVQKIQ